MPQEAVAKILADDPERFGAMAEAAQLQPGEADVALDAIFFLILSRDNGRGLGGVLDGRGRRRVGDDQAPRFDEVVEGGSESR